MDASAARGSCLARAHRRRDRHPGLDALGAAPARDAVDWGRLDIWWGDERFLAGGDRERNDTGARAALLDHVAVSPDRMLAMPVSDGPDGANRRRPPSGTPAGCGPPPRPRNADRCRPSTCCCSASDRRGMSPRSSPATRPLRAGPDRRGRSWRPKPPPTRLSLTFPAIRAARDVWIIASGADKAGAVRLALSAAGPVQVPAAGARGRQQTISLLDRAAAERLPAQLGRLLSPDGPRLSP